MIAAYAVELHESGFFFLEASEKTGARVDFHRHVL